MSGGVLLSDASSRVRVGCKGPAAEAWLAERDIAVPRGANSFSVDARGLLSARLATSEFLFEAFDSEAAHALAPIAHSLEVADVPSGVYPVLRHDCVVELAGPATQELLLQTCAVDLTPIERDSSSEAGPVILTSMIGVGVVIACRRSQQGARFTVWSDPSFRHYFWHQLLAIATELGDGAHPDSLLGRV